MKLVFAFFFYYFNFNIFYFSIFRPKLNQFINNEWVNLK